MQQTKQKLAWLDTFPVCPSYWIESTFGYGFNSCGFGSLGSKDSGSTFILFLTARGQRMTPRRVGAMCKAAADGAGVPATFHALRRGSGNRVSTPRLSVDASQEGEEKRDSPAILNALPVVAGVAVV